ncbi:Secretion protein HlyD [Anaerovibrio sp. JC8]|uniref:efflux RND transporter periplasmic adaptor subunit n=1 Tax=Anaerovibrio sp. JC8 TaxID=1240085 RepID=UPI000A0A0A5B|nr:efflux RND transporter periplasmic adaptor subunit [Anaerovibrio sp. JC8]ORT99738.1 Secretion protein HlyD [Anaerovibrio sp. JC8]
MKRYFYIGVAVIVAMAFAIVAYGAWLNYSDENQIANRMDNRRVQLIGAKAKIQELRPTLSLPSIRFSSRNMTDAVALTDGRILRWYVDKNSPISKGQPLLSMANEQIPLRIQQATSAVSRAEAMLAQTYSSYQRQGRLLAKNATSQEKYEEAQAQYLAAQQALLEAQAQRDQVIVQQGWLTVTAPISGEVLVIYQREGTYVQAGTPVALVGDFDNLTFSLNLQDVDSRHLELGQTTELTFPERIAVGKAYDTDYGAGNTGWNQKITATLKEIVPPLSQPANMRRSVWEVDNTTRLLEPMTYTDVTMRTNKPYYCLAVPLKAMIDKSHDKVFVVDDEGILQLRNVVTGPDDGKQIEIVSGLQPGDVVAVGNFEGLSDGMKVDITLEGDEG